MPDHLDDYLDVQRAALREFLELSAEAVEPVVTQIESEYGEAARSAERERDSAVRKIEARHREQTEAAEHAYADTVRRIREVYESDTSRLEANTRTMRGRLTGTAGEREARARKKRDDTVWMAETVAVSAQEAIDNDFRKLQKDVAAAREQLASYREDAEWQLSRYERELGDAPEPSDEHLPQLDDPGAAYRTQCEAIENQLAAMESMKLPNLFVGAQPYVMLVSACAAVLGMVAIVAFLKLISWTFFAVAGPLAAAATGVILVVVGKQLKHKANIQVLAAHDAFLSLWARAAALLGLRVRYAELRRDEDQARVIESRDREIEAARHEYDGTVNVSTKENSSKSNEVQQAYGKLHMEIEGRRDAGLAHADQERRARLETFHEQYERELEAAGSAYEARMEQCRSHQAAALGELEQRWDDGLSRINALLDRTKLLSPGTLSSWSDDYWSNWQPSDHFTSSIPLGRWTIGVSQLAQGVRRRPAFSANDETAISILALLTLPQRASLFMESDRPGRMHAINTLRAVMLRLLTSLPPGRAHFTIVDPVGLGENFAGFMHLADYEEALVGGRIWTESDHIEQRLAELTGHMENVIQKYLRNEFDTIDAYNEQAGELAEPYRFLIVSDFPVNFSEEACRRLSSIITSGARCGVYSLIFHDTRQAPPPGIEIEDLREGSVHLVHEDDRFVWQDDLLRQFPLTVDAPPNEDRLTQLMHVVGQGAKDSLRVEVPFETIAPSPDRRWSAESSRELHVPVGRKGAVRLQELELGRGVSQHVLIAGKTGSGKSTLLHVMITNLALWYSPDEIEFYLIDFKKGVEFKTYVTHRLPHARAIGIESDREFGLSVLQRLDAEMTRRGDLFRQRGVQDLGTYRQASGESMPRTLLIVDEFQVFFSEDDRIAQDAGVLLDRLVRQGRAFGIHVLLGSQTLGGMSGLARSTMGQMAVRIALQCSESDSQLIFDDTNVVARLLTRPGEAIYNDAGGLIEGNNPFQVAWLPDERRDKQLGVVKELANGQGNRWAPAVVFEGNVPADVAMNSQLARLINTPHWQTMPTAPQVWLGEAVAIKDPTSVAFRRQSGANMFMVGQRQDAALAMMAVSMVSLAARHEPLSASFVIMDGCTADDPHAGYLEQVASVLPHASRIVGWRDIENALSDLAKESRRRQEADQTDAPAIYVFLLGLQRYRMLRRKEDDFSFSADSEASASPDKLFAELLREGPSYGIHVIIWADTPASLERTLDRQSMGTFDHRVLFQISASDSSNLIDSPAANTLGFHRALLYSEEQGVAEKFRPYAVPDAAWLDQIRARFRNGDEHVDRPTSMPNTSKDPDGHR